jgi:hypothetical protein
MAGTTKRKKTGNVTKMHGPGGRTDSESRCREAQLEIETSSCPTQCRRPGTKANRFEKDRRLVLNMNGQWYRYQWYNSRVAQDNCGPETP